MIDWVYEMIGERGKNLGNGLNYVKCYFKFFRGWVVDRKFELYGLR